MSDCVHDTVQPNNIRPFEDSTISLDDSISEERNFNESSQHSRQRADERQQYQQEHPLPNIVDVNDDISLDDGNVSKSSDDELIVTSPFDCNICFDPLSEPVVTQCGHLYCWPCLYRWLEPGILPHERHIFDRSSQSNNNRAGQIPPNTPPASSFPSNINRSRRCCPVCKSPCAISTIVPIYVRHDISSKRRQTAAQTGLRQRKTSRKNESNDVAAAADVDVDDDTSPTIPSRPQPHRPQPTTTSTPRPQPTTMSTPRSPTTPPPNDMSNVMNRAMRDSSFHQSFFAALSSDAVRTPALHHPMHPEDVVHNGRSMDETVMAAATVTGDDRWNSTVTGGEDATTEFLSRLLLMLGSFVIFCLLLF